MESRSALSEYARSLGENAKAAAQVLRIASGAQRNRALRALAKILRREEASILAANAEDAKEAKTQNLAPAMIDRLLLNPKRLAGVAKSVTEIALLPDPVGRVLEKRRRKDGLKISRVSVPIGTVLFIYESRPNVTIDGAALCLKSGNAVILRGGKEAHRTNAAFGACITEALREAGLPEHAVQIVNTPDRALLDPLLRDEAHLDLVIPRGGEALIRAVAEKSRVPVIKHYQGICHVYVDRSADPKAARNIVVNAKVQRPGVCNAMETLLLDRKLNPRVGAGLIDALADQGVELFGDADAQKLSAAVMPATDQNFDTEYLDMKCSVKVVDGVQGAIAHIARHGSEHTDAVVAESSAVQKAFTAGVDSSSVMINASTRFADGGEYGLGAEVGISTGKLHARGPMGVDSLTTYKWIVEGKGHVRK